MKKLTDFKPLERVTLPGLGELDCTGLILVVGPNSSGKTQFLHDLHLCIAGEPRTLVVAKEIKIRKPDYEPFLECLTREGYLKNFVDDAGTQHFRPMAPYVGTGSAPGQIKTNQAQSWYQAINPDDLSQHQRRNEFFYWFGRILVTVLFLQRRLTSVSETGAFDYEKEPPKNDLLALHINDSAKHELAQEVKRTFSLAVWPDASRQKVVCIRVSDLPEIPSAEDRLSPQKMSAYRTMETEGDGLKSYMATCIALLLGRRPVCLIDEPEMCLHPPQAYNLGQFIGKFGASSESATFVATHSSQTLRGVIQTAEKLQIVRLTRNGGNFQAHLVRPEMLKEALERPTVRAETVLDGIFAETVAVIEGDGDRAVYQATWDTVNPEFEMDIHYAAVGGTGGIGDTCKLYRILRIPVAVVADLDVITDKDQLKKILSELTDNSTADRLSHLAAEIVNAIRSTPPEVEEHTVRKQLQSTLEGGLVWSQGDDVQLRKTLIEIARNLDRMRRLKRGGVTAFPPDIKTKLESLINECKLHGLFLVPVGELEEWLSTHGITASKQNKWAWANEAAILVRKTGAKRGDIWDFIREVGSYLKSSIETTNP